MYAAAGYHSLSTPVPYDPIYAFELSTLLNEKGLDKLRLFDGTSANADIDSAVEPGTYSRVYLNAGAYELLQPGRADSIELSENNACVDWVPSGPVVLIHCVADDVVPEANRGAAATELGGCGPGVVAVDVLPVPFVDALLGSIHTAAYPTAMLAAITAIQKINAPLP